MRTLATTVLLAIALTFPLTAFPQVGSLWEDKPLLDRSGRKALASDWRAQFAKLDAQVASLSPTQQAWIAKEYEDEIRNAGNRYTRRALAAMESLEYQLYIAKPRLTEINRLLVALSESAVPDQKTEIALWTQLAYQLADKSLWQAVENLVQRKAIDRKVNGFESYYLENHVLRGQMILGRFALPYLQGLLPQ